MRWTPERMAEIEIEVPEQYVSRVTETLADEGVLFVENMSYLGSDTGSLERSEWQQKAADFVTLERQIQATMKSLGIDEGDVPEKSQKMLTEPTYMQEFANQMENEVSQAISEMTHTQKRVELLKRYTELVQPFIDLDIPLDAIRNRRYLFSILGTIPHAKIERFKLSMANIPFALLELKETKEHAIVLLLGTRRHKEYLRRAARSAYLNTIDLPDEYQGTPAEIMAELIKEIETLENKSVTVNDTVNSMRIAQAEKLREMYWHVHMSQIMAETMTRYGKLRHSYLIVGWVPSSQLIALESRLEEISHEVLIDVKTRPDNPLVNSAPTAMKHKKFLSGFQKLVTTYGLPGYNELDPTLLLVITFPLIFGAMFGDLGQGFFLALLGLLLMSRKIKKLSRYATLGSVVLLCGISAMVFGALYGSVFAFEDLLPAIWQRPMDNITSILVITIAGGAVLLSLANILSLFNYARNRRWLDFVFNKKGLAGLILYWSLLSLVLSFVIKPFPIPSFIITILITISGFMVFFSELFTRLIKRERPLFEFGFLIYLIQAFFELFETLLGYFSNSLSFVRVGAFAIAHSGLSGIFLILSEMLDPSKGLVYWLVVIFGNIFILGFEGLIVSIQTMRLQYYEFFSKFFTGGGKRFTPFQVPHSTKQGDK